MENSFDMLGWVLDVGAGWHGGVVWGKGGRAGEMVGIWMRWEVGGSEVGDRCVEVKGKGIDWVGSSVAGRR